MIRFERFYRKRDTNNFMLIGDGSGKVVPYRGSSPMQVHRAVQQYGRYLVLGMGSHDLFNMFSIAHIKITVIV